MPPETHSIYRNPLYESLQRKLPQLADARPGVLRLILVADVGSTLLNRMGKIGERDYSNRRLSGTQIVNQFFSESRSKLDGVVVFAPHRKYDAATSSRLGGESGLQWKVTVFAETRIMLMKDRIEELSRFLPAPRFEGYQARSLARQSAFSPDARGWYLGMRINKYMEDFTVRVSARALLDFLAGRASEEQFRHWMGQRNGEANFFKRWLDQGMTLADISLEGMGLDQEDDYIVLRFRDDAVARPFRPPNADGESL